MKSLRTPFCVPIGIPQIMLWLTSHVELEYHILTFAHFDILNLSITIQPLCSLRSRLEHHTLACALVFTFFENQTSCSLVLSYTLLFLHMGFALYKMSFWSFHTLMFIICTWVFIFFFLEPTSFFIIIVFCFVFILQFLALPCTYMSYKLQQLSRN